MPKNDARDKKTRLTKTTKKSKGTKKAKGTKRTIRSGKTTKKTAIGTRRTANKRAKSSAKGGAQEGALGSSKTRAKPSTKRATKRSRQQSAKRRTKAPAKSKTVRDTARRKQQRPPRSEQGPRPTLLVKSGVEGGHDGLPRQGDQIPRKAYQSPGTQRRTLTTGEYVDGVLSGDRMRLARAITLIESNAPAHIDQAQEVLKVLLPYTGNSVRLGITGVPGAGKSTFIEALGRFLTDRGHRVAVTAVDPSSSLSGGSILGDKTRMEGLAADPDAFIRPSPSGGALGGVARKTRETMLLFEAAGYDVLLVETVGVGQSEITVRSMVDFFLLMLVAGAGDELQGIKKGVIEIADAVLIHKADGQNRAAAELSRGEYERALHYLRPATEGWQTRAFTASALTGEGIPELWQVVETFCRRTRESGVFARRRRSQERDWVHALVQEQLRERFLQNPEVRHRLPGLERAVMEGELPATTAARILLQLFAADQGETAS
jgi:LAO/AO transport system kinase